MVRLIVEWAVRDRVSMGGAGNRETGYGDCMAEARM